MLTPQPQSLPSSSLFVRISVLTRKIGSSLLLLSVGATITTVNCISMAANSNNHNPPIVTYWPGRGRAEPLRCILAASNVEFQHCFLTSKEQLQDLVQSNKLEYDQVPLVEIDGLNLIQSIPTAYYLAQKYGLVIENKNDSNYSKKLYTIQQMYTSIDEIRSQTFLKYPFGFRCDSAILETEMFDNPKSLMQRYAPKWEAQYALHEEGPFLFGSVPCLVDIGIFELLDFYNDIYGQENLKNVWSSKFPKLVTVYNSCLNLGRLQQWTQVERPKRFLPFDEYAKLVRETLS